MHRQAVLRMIAPGRGPDYLRWLTEGPRKKVSGLYIEKGVKSKDTLAAGDIVVNRYETEDSDSLERLFDDEDVREFMRGELAEVIVIPQDEAGGEAFAEVHTEEFAWDAPDAVDPTARSAFRAARSEGAGLGDDERAALAKWLDAHASAAGITHLEVLGAGSSIVVFLECTGGAAEAAAASSSAADQLPARMVPVADGDAVVVFREKVAWDEETPSHYVDAGAAAITADAG
jgi:hypothetical protein